ncbi:MAG: hypothetical protein RDU20_07415 [Desulfomonilaceae bacterium]|nr:hypothetical protein [Desulfomonilaceae bacterium]
MLGHTRKYLFLLVLLIAATAGAAWAQDAQPGAQTDPTNARKPIYKVKPEAPEVFKVKPEYGLRGLERFSPFAWGLDCFLPTTAQRQFEAGGRVWFARVQGQVSKGGRFVGFEPPSVVDFDDHLGLSKSGNVIWSVDARYQILPRWGIRYSFTPMSMDATNQGTESFVFMGQTFTFGTPIRSKWDRYEHRAGLSFDIARSANSVTRAYADWLHIQDKLTLHQGFGYTQALTWDDDKNIAVLGLELNKCLRNFRGNSLAINGKAGVAFLDDHNGYELEAGLSYIVPIRAGRFGFVKGGYRYAHLNKDKDYEVFKTTMDGAFIQAGFIF